MKRSRYQNLGFARILARSVRSLFFQILYSVFRTRLKRTVESRASRVAIEVTNLCNADCSFCAYRYQQRSVGIMSNATFHTFLEKYIAYGGGELKFTPLVGDPLLDKSLIEKIEYARRFKEITHIYTYTNAIGFQHFDIERFLNSGINEIQISTCIGNQEMYKRIFGVNKYHVVINNIEKLLTLNNSLGKKVTIGLSIRGDKPYEKIWNSPDYIRIAQLYGSAIPILDDAYDSWSGMIKKEDLPIGQGWRKVSNKKKYEPCSLLYKGLLVLGDGEVNACWTRDMEATLLVGNIHNESIDDIWKGEKLRSLRENWEQGNLPEVCKKCNQYTSLSDYLTENSSTILRSG